MITRLVKLSIAIVFFIFRKMQDLLLRLRGKKAWPSLVIITYHPVKNADASRFEKQMDALLKAGTPVSLSRDLNSLKEGVNIAVTFDDAYQSVLTNAVPVLRRKNIPATIFVPTGYLGKQPGWIKNAGHPYAKETVMTEEQLKVLPEDLISIGSHSVTHINLNVADAAVARNEIQASKSYLENILDKKVNLFAAPFATLNESFLPLFREAQYERVFLNIPTFPATKTDLYLLGRTSIEPADWPIEYRLKMRGAYQWLPLAFGLKKKFLT